MADNESSKFEDFKTKLEYAALKKARTIIDPILGFGRPEDTTERTIVLAILKAIKELHLFDNDARKEWSAAHPDSDDYYSFHVVDIIATACWAAIVHYDDDDLAPISIGGSTFTAFAHAFVILHAASTLDFAIDGLSDESLYCDDAVDTALDALDE